jgi:hypothetical protein
MLARRLVRGYQRQAAATIEPAELGWHQALACLRALSEVASWAHTGTADTRAGHPWLVSGPAFARRLASLTRVPVRAR